MASMDRLSDLPDGVICHILSFLPTKNSVSTTTLARRWRFLWAYVPTIDLKTEHNNLDSDSDSDSDSHADQRFADFVYMVMLKYKFENMNAFCLHCDYTNLTRQELETWITIAIDRNVKCVDLSLRGWLHLPLCLFTCKTLVDLSLKLCTYEPVTVDLPCLKKLSLISVTFNSDQDLPALLSGCPVLDELIIKANMDQEMIHNITSPTIKRLTVHFYPFDIGYDNSRLKLNVPALRYLHLKDAVSRHVETETIASLVEAYIYLDFYIDAHSYFASVLNFVDSLYNAKFLKLSSSKAFSVEIFAEHDSKSNIRFDNLIELELAADYLFLTKFLHCADNLQVLVIREENLRHWIEPELVPYCLSSSLETIRIYILGGSEPELDMVAYILKNGKVLKKMEIYCHQDDALEKISLFQRGSEACELALYISKPRGVLGQISAF